MEVAIVGGGASGFFAAITAKEKYPEAHVVIFEKTEKLLAKVKVSGGGRCNVTTGCPSVKELIAAYPRGGRALRKVFHRFDNPGCHGVVFVQGRAPGDAGRQVCLSALPGFPKHHRLFFGIGQPLKDRH